MASSNKTFRAYFDCESVIKYSSEKEIIINFIQSAANIYQ